jgi:hypothetical protein
MEEKDFLFFNYSWVRNSTIIFEKFKDMGHTIDIIDERTITSFIPNCKYKNVVLYLHEEWTLPITSRLLLNELKDSFLIQHDDTDFEQIQNWSPREPDLYMHRELTDDTIISTKSPVYPFHFPVDSIYDEKLQNKEIDVSFMGCPTNYRRIPFINKIMELSKNSLSHLNWYIEFNHGRNPEKFKEITNKSKITLHYFGNSYDSLRIWEVISANSALIMPKFRNWSVNDNHMPFNEYLKINDDFSDLEEKILYLLDNNRYKSLANDGFNAYNNYHNPDKCFEYYYNKVIQHCRI